ncbi:MAG TPA: hypothetical protein VE961_22180 [Pyrinomonadaceae bacterium]|nr:hypothetical protein [Pyrinomonadaceae bacterium]
MTHPRALGVPQNSGGEGNTSPCDVTVPNDDRSQILLGVVLWETSALHNNNGVWSLDQYTKDAADKSMIHFQSDDPAHDPVQEVRNEIYYMSSALLNQIGEGKYGGSLEAAAQGESVGYHDHGQSANGILNDHPDLCLKAGLLLDVLDYIDRNGTASFEKDKPVRYWRGVGQGGGKRNFRKGDVRAGNSDFMYLPPTIGGKPNPDYKVLPYWRNGRWSW